MGGIDGSVGSASWSSRSLPSVPASDLAIALVERTVTHVLGPGPLPRLDLDDGVPSSMRTMVVVPTLLTAVRRRRGPGRAASRSTTSGNREGDLRFALLSDWVDAPTEQLPGDDELLSAAAAAIDAAQRAPRRGPGRWRPVPPLPSTATVERGRGLLDGLGAQARQAPRAQRAAARCDRTDLPDEPAAASVPPTGVRYVVTLDADTRLPRGAVARLVGTMAHPLNRPAFDPSRRARRRGLRRAAAEDHADAAAEREASIFQRSYAGSAGIDPYASAVSDVYQDLFGEGTYTGKGIYDVDAFEAALAERVPENALLSHDLFEGVFARAGLVTDVELFEEFPSNYLVAAARQHRWARGDWQLLPWILGRARDATGGRRSRRRPRDRPLEDDRQPPPHAVGALVAGHARRRLDAAVGRCRALDRVRPGVGRIPAAVPVAAGLLPRRRRASRSEATCGPSARDVALARSTSASPSRSWRTRRG